MALIPLLVALLVASPAFASKVCTLERICPNDGMCDEEKVTLNWSMIDEGHVMFDDEEFSAKRLSKNTNMAVFGSDGGQITVRTEPESISVRKGRNFGMIAPGESEGGILVTLIGMPRKYTEYAQAMSLRSVYHGDCGGLF